MPVHPATPIHTNRQHREAERKSTRSNGLKTVVFHFFSRWCFTVPDLLKSMSSHKAESGESNQSLSRPHVNKSYLKFTNAAGKETDLTREIQFGNMTYPCTVCFRLIISSNECFTIVK